MSHCIAVDFGGTNIRSAYFPEPEPPPGKQVKIPTQADSGPEKVIARLVDAIIEVMPDSREGIQIGIGTPGPLDPVSGTVFKAPNLPGWTDIPLKSQLEEKLGCPVHLGNDANVAALGEWKFGAGRGSSHMIYLTISTGIGGGVIVDNQLLLGADGLAGELGHITVKPGGAPCGCGGRGHIEAEASGTAIARKAKQGILAGEETALKEIFDRKGKITSIDVGEAAKHGDDFALDLIAEAGNLLGHLLADLAHIFNPQTFVLGGGVSQLGDLLFNPVKSSFRENVMDPAYCEQVRIVPPMLGDDAGLVGAMVLVNQG
ncbi:MAG: ROK family protein [Anaerolineales bacterium]|jgi:glucokinase